MKSGICIFNVELCYLDFSNQLSYLFNIFQCFIYFLAFSTNLTVQYSVFGSILTAGGIEGALVNGKLADVIGRRGVRIFGHPF